MSYEKAGDTMKSVFENLPWMDGKNKSIEELSREREQLLEKEGVFLVKICSICGIRYETGIKVLPSEQDESFICPECATRKMVELEEKKRTDRFLSQVPPRFREIGDCQYKKMKESTCLIIWGGFGTGKTWEAYAVCKELYMSKQINSFKICTEIGLLNDIKAGFSDGTFDTRVKTYSSIDLLIVDEIGKSNDSEFNKAQLFEILNNRYNWMRRTILICNASSQDELYEIIPPAILDRYRESVINMGGKSRRYEK